MADDTTIQVWSDYVCPFCYLALPVLARARAELGVLVRWRAFELRPEPQPTLDPDGDYLHNVWDSAVYPMAEARGMALRLPPVQPRSRLAAIAATHAQSVGPEAFDALHEALFRAFFVEGLDIGDRRVLLDVATVCGLDSAALHRAFDAAALAAGVAEDDALAARLGCSGVPAGGMRHGAGQPFLLSGAQPFDVLAHAIERARAGEGRS